MHRVSSSGTVHAIFRIGDRLAARFRLQIGDVESVWCELRMEADAAREIAGCTRFPTPEPLAIGALGRGYPMPWLIQTWLDGTVAIERDPGESVVFATDLAEFITDVRHIDTHGRRHSGYGRGGVLAAHDEWIQERLTRSDGLLNVAVLRRIWETMRALPRGDSPDVMNHGDLLPGNLLVHNGRLAGVLDVGDAEWERGKAWAFQQAMGAVWYYVNSNPQFSQVGRRTLHRICAESR